MGAPTWPPNPLTFGAPRRSRGAPLYSVSSRCGAPASAPAAGQRRRPEGLARRAVVPDEDARVAVAVAAVRLRLPLGLGCRRRLPLDRLVEGARRIIPLRRGHVEQ